MAGLAPGPRRVSPSGERRRLPAPRWAFGRLQTKGKATRVTLLAVPQGARLGSGRCPQKQRCRDRWCLRGAASARPSWALRSAELLLPHRVRDGCSPADLRLAPLQGLQLAVLSG